MVSVERTGLAEVSYEVLTELPQLSALSGEWNSLLGRSACNRAFSSAQWFISVCKLRLSELTPYVVVARRDGALAGLLPLVLTNDGDCLEFPSYLNDYNDVVTEPEDHAVIEGLLDYVVSPAGGYRRITLLNLRGDSKCLQQAQKMKTTRLTECSLQQDRSCFYLRLSGSYDEYIRTKSRTFRKQLGRARGEAESHDVRVLELDPGSFAHDQLPEIFLSLNFARFGSNSHFSSPVAQAFVRAVFPSLFIERRLRAFALFEAERIIGIDICMVGSNSLCTWNGGFGAAAARWSPGRLLINAGIERAYALQLEEYDFLRGSHAYKARWASGTRMLNRVEIRLRY